MENADIFTMGNENSRKAHTLLVIEDDLNIQALLKHTLIGDGYHVMAASDCAEALTQFDRGAVPELIILDLMLPGMSGLEFLELVRRRYPHIKTVVISATEGIDTVVKAMRLGALDYIHKPFKMQEIKVAVNEALQFRELQMELEYLKRKSTFRDEIPFLYNSNSMAEIMETIQQVAATNVPVLVTGESGVGKEVVAREIHQRSQRSQGPFVKVNCAAIPSNLLEGELFGFEKGAFTGAVASKPARFEKAENGTLFLDEIGELAQEIQAKFLHVLQDGAFNRLGSNRMQRSNARIIVATNQDVEELVRSGRFRPDLYFRLNVIRIHIPPLRERRSDIPLLADNFLAINSQKFGKFVSFDDETMEFLMRHDWPGNVRELQNAVSRYVVLGKLVESGQATDVIPVRSSVDTRTAAEPGPDDRQDSPQDDPPEVVSLKQVAREAALKAEREAILRVLEATKWNKSRAAKVLKISYKALLYKIRDCGIDQTDTTG
ncbi:MAG: sigma-54 dependent transcriptional regulator [bacterium]|nr:sigma-54 dependent transcriptional regulator [bacterium]